MKAVLDVVKEIGKWLLLLGMLPLLIPMVALLLLLAIFIIPIIIIYDKRHKRKVNKFLQENDYTYFFIYSSGKKKAAICEKHIIPTLAPGVKVVKFDGMKFDSFFIPETYYQVINHFEKGYPLVGKIEEGKVYTESLKEAFQQLVLKEKEVARFIDVLHLKMETL